MRTEKGRNGILLVLLPCPCGVFTRTTATNALTPVREPERPVQRAAKRRLLQPLRHYTSSGTYTGANATVNLTVAQTSSSTKISITSPPNGSTASGKITVSAKVVGAAAGSYTKWYLPNAPVGGKCAAGQYDNARKGCSLYGAFSFSYNTAILPNGSSRFYVRLVGTSAAASDWFLAANGTPLAEVQRQRPLAPWLLRRRQLRRQRARPCPQALRRRLLVDLGPRSSRSGGRGKSSTSKMCSPATHLSISATRSESAALSVHQLLVVLRISFERKHGDLDLLPDRGHRAS